jgi:hypothetical protein
VAPSGATLTLSISLVNGSKNINGSGTIGSGGTTKGGGARDTLACRVHCSHYQVVEFFCELQQNDQ